MSVGSVNLEKIFNDLFFVFREHPISQMIFRKGSEKIVRQGAGNLLAFVLPDFPKRNFQLAGQGNL